MEIMKRCHRRAFLEGAAASMLALPGATRLLAPRHAEPGPHFKPRARHVIFLFMYGGPSQMDTFDHKPELHRLDGRTIPVKTRGRAGARNEGRVVGPRWRFRPCGESGKMVSELFPHLGEMVDRLSFVHSMYAESPIHGSAMLMMNTGRLLSGHPSLGAWVNHGLGTANANLPGHVVMLDRKGGPIGGAKNWTSGYMPASLQGTVMRPDGEPILDLAPPPELGRRLQRELLDRLRLRNERHLERNGMDETLRSRMATYELAYRMQDAAPEAMDWRSESEETHRLYGIDRERTHHFGRNCLLARRLVERGVRFVQLYSGGGHDDDTWDAHGDLKFNHERHAGRTDRPIAGLLRDLERRGLLEETLVVWTGEFGRQPTAEYASGTGRDHNAYGFTCWMAGGGLRPGVSVGETDELGSAAVTQRCHVKNLHATILTLLGLDPERLSFPFSGLDQKLVGVEGANVIPGLI